MIERIEYCRLDYVREQSKASILNSEEFLKLVKKNAIARLVSLISQCK